MRPLDRFWLVLLIVPPLACALLGNAYLVHVVTLVGIYALLGIGYQLVFGQLGGLSLAQGALFGVGAYLTALLAPHVGVLALPLSVIGAGVVALIAGWPTLRLHSHYFALATLALAALANLVALNWEALTGGANGLIGFGRGLPHGVLLLALVCVAVRSLDSPIRLRPTRFRGHGHLPICARRSTMPLESTMKHSCSTPWGVRVHFGMVL